MNRNFLVIKAILIVSLLVLAVLPMSNFGFTRYGQNEGLGNIPESFKGEGAAGNFGTKSSIVGDVNGDGFDDILMSEYQNDDGGMNAGKVYLFFGKAAAFAQDIDVGTADASWVGENSQDEIGKNIAGAGDVNGDGYDDFIVSSVSYSNGIYANSGKTYVVFGRHSGWTTDTNIDTANASFIGEFGGDGTGSSIAGAGDVNGDGYDDFLIGSTNYRVGGMKRGAVYLILGHDSVWFKNRNLTYASVKFIGTFDGGRFGRCVDGGRDVNGDDLDDIIIGAPYVTKTETYDGLAVIFHGRYNWKSNYDADQNNGSFRGAYQSDLFGYECRLIEDIDGNGLDDVMIATPYFDGGIADDAGAVYIFQSFPGLIHVNSSVPDADYYFWGESFDDRLGDSLATAGDVNGDGFGDIVLGSESFSNDLSTRGKAYLLNGSADPSIFVSGNVSETCQSSYLGAAEFDRAGNCVSGDGDIDGDGFDDLLISAYRAHSQRGAVYIVHPFENEPPNAVNSVTASLDNSYQPATDNAWVNDTLYVQLSGTTIGMVEKDLAVVHVTSDSNPVGFKMRLREEDPASGEYRGELVLGNRTRKNDNWIKVADGDTLKITSVDNPSMYAGLLIKDGCRITPMEDNLTAIEDAEYSEFYTVKGKEPFSWDYNIDAEWLQFDEQYGHLYGTPNNTHSGKDYTVSLNVSDASLSWYHKEFVIHVNNVAPEINVTLNLTAYEDEPYYVDFDCSDDGQGNVSWHMNTLGTPWFSINSTTGVVSGTPLQEDVKDYTVDFWVDDGAGGTTHEYQTISVMAVNDAPILNGTPVVTATAESYYYCNFTVFDEDSSSFLWTLNTNATWITATNGKLVGTPKNTDQGWYWVNVTVEDEKGLSDSINYTLTVFRIGNRPPTWSSVPNATEYAVLNNEFKFQVHANDPDGDIVSYFVKSLPSSKIFIGSNGGMLTWTPDTAGDYVVTINATDGELVIFYTFNINVTGGSTDLPPTFDTTPDLNATVGEEWSYQPHAASGKESALISVSTKPDGMEFSLGVLKWTPEFKGNYTVKIVALGAGGTTVQEFTIWVHPGGSIIDPDVNHVPTITDIPMLTATRDETFTYQIQASDPDGDDLIYSKVNGPDGLTVSESGLITWTPNWMDVGMPHEVIIAVSDGELITQEEFTIQVAEKNATGDAGAMCLAFFLTILIILVIIIISVIVLIVILRRKKKEAPREDEPEDMGPTYESPDALEPEVGDDIFKQKEHQAFAKEVSGSGHAEPMLLDTDEPPEMAAPDMPTEIVDDPLELMNQGPAPILDGASEPQGPPNTPPGTERAPLALPPAVMLDVTDDPMISADFTEVMLITREGLLLNHYAKDPSTEIDHDILSGMLTAVQAFVSDSFRSMDSTLRRLEMAEFTVLIEPGKYITAVGITKDRENRELGDQLLRMMKDVDKNMAEQFADWSGDIDAIRDVEDYIQKLLEGGYE